MNRNTFTMLISFKRDRRGFPLIFWSHSPPQIGSDLEQQILLDPKDDRQHEEFILAGTTIPIIRLQPPLYSIKAVLLGRMLSSMMHNEN